MVFNGHFISKTIKTIMREEVFSLSQGDLFVTKFEWKFTALTAFVPKMQLPNEEKARMFKEIIHPRYKDMLFVQIRHT